MQSIWFTNVLHSYSVFLQPPIPLTIVVSHLTNAFFTSGKEEVCAELRKRMIDVCVVCRREMEKTGF